MVVANFSVPKVQRPEINVSASQIESQDFDVNVKTTEHNQLFGRDDENCHPIGAITGLAEALETYIHTQGTASSVWEINHNLNKYPAVSVVDSAGNEIIAEVRYTDLNNITIIMHSEFKGKAFLN